MFPRQLSDQVKILKLSDYATAATTAVNGTGVDMQADGGWGSVMFVTNFGTAAADNLLKAQQSSDNAGSDAYADLAGSEVNAGASDEVQWVEIINPKERYVRPVATRATSSTLGPIWAILSNPRNIPYDNNTAGTIAGHALVAPAEGTA